MIAFCPANQTLSDFWINRAFGICFLNTLASSLFLGFVVLFGVGELFFYRKYATRHRALVLPWNKLFYLQIASHLALCCLSWLGPVVGMLLSGGEVFLYGYEYLNLASGTVGWLLCLAVLLVERNFQLPASPSQSHGAVPIISWGIAFVFENLAFLSLNNVPWYDDLGKNAFNKWNFAVFVMRYCFTFAVFTTGIKAPGISRTRDFFPPGSDTEAILVQEEVEAEAQGSTWKGFFKKLAKLLPYMWPKKSFRLQIRVTICLILLVLVRVVNVFVPLYSKRIINALSADFKFCWDLILIFVGLKAVQGGGTGGQGLFNNARSFLWIKVQQYTTKEIQVELFQHLHGLSMRWHLGRKTGEVLRVMERGTNSVNGLLSYLVFNILPTIIDIIVAIVYFTASFNIWFGLIVFVTMGVYLACTVITTEWRTKYRRMMNQADNEQRAKGVDSLLNFETVKYYGAERFEADRYEESIVKYQTEEWKSLASLTLLNMSQNVIMNVGLMAGSLYCAHLVADKTLSVGDYVLFGTYIAQLMAPLSYLGTLYRVIQEAFINMENMFELMEQDQEITDAPNALPIVATKGKIEFRNVNFHYAPERVILKNVSFIAEPGQTVAFVGPTGAGKSTIIRLLFRFYDVVDGEVLVDEQNVRIVTQESLRKAIGVVPQDTVLFNDTIKYNIAYAKPNAEDNEVHSAAAHADIHTRILTFPEGYESKVGERGLKLSGGEKQRVAIARTLLKAPQVVLLDEATSALDTQTERNIQLALTQVCKDRTTLIVAHRLSTITHADQILVLNEGEIVERGTHEELLQAEGVYHSMWNQQSTVAHDEGEQGNNDDRDSGSTSSEVNGARPRNKGKKPHPHVIRT